MLSENTTTKESDDDELTENQAGFDLNMEKFSSDFKANVLEDSQMENDGTIPSTQVQNVQRNFLHEQSIPYVDHIILKEEKHVLFIESQSDRYHPRRKGSSFDLVAYCDDDFAGDKVERKSTSGSCQFLGQALIEWSCRKQNTMAVSTTEAEYVSAASCCSQILW
ncbi:hypothetical protein MTR_0303s0010, partial [Medicago truncatula]